VRTLLAASILALIAPPAWAVLGESLDSLAGDEQRLHGEARVTANEGFSILEIAGADGTVVRQFASPSGRIFGVAWHGPFVPSLAPLLGTYFPEFQEAARRPVRRRGPLAARTSHLAVETGGHMRAFHGRVYLPGEMPAAVSAEAVR
jgi:hypothetical protein